MIDDDINRVLDSSPDQTLELDDAGEDAPEPPCELISGAAGTGKTFSVRQRIEQDPTWALLCATTGIAAVNLGTITLHSALGLHPDALDDQFTSGFMRQRMHQIALQYRRVGIDESSMLSATLLDMLYQTAAQVNEYKDVQAKGAFGITLIADMCQLPPIKEPWCFTAECWPKFEANTTRLTKNYRQGAGLFLDALNFLRSGNGREGAAALQTAGARIVRRLDPNFDGTVILGRNQEVDNYNWLRYNRLKGEAFEFKSSRWGKQSGGWNNIPDTLRLKEGALVMVLSNDTERDPETKEPMFRWVNGDTGHVIKGSTIRLVRTGQEVQIDYVERRVQHKHAPEEFTDEEIDDAREHGTKLPDGSFWDRRTRFWVRGAINYMPLRLAYATTVHKSQGLTLDRIQVDLRHAFLGEPAMVYVAMSRCRTAEGLHIVGDAKMIERRCKIDEAVRRWL